MFSFPAFNLSAAMPIILASTSPRRRELLQQVAVAHTCVSLNIDERQQPQELALDYIQRMVSQKAQAALGSLPDNINQAVIITADTIGVLANGTVLQKPTDFADACVMWQQMSASTHQVWTAVQVSRVEPVESKRQLVWQKQTPVATAVTFIELNHDMMQRYWQSGEPADKAGGYAIQGLGAAWVKTINGSYSNVVGLPLVETLQLIEEAMTS